MENNIFSNYLKSYSKTYNKCVCVTYSIKAKKNKKVDKELADQYEKIINHLNKSPHCWIHNKEDNNGN